MGLESQPYNLLACYEYKNIMLLFLESETQFSTNMDNHKSQYMPNSLYIAESKNQYLLKIFSISFH